MKMAKPESPVCVSFEDFLSEDQSTPIKKIPTKKGKNVKNKKSETPAKKSTRKKKLEKNTETSLKSLYGKRGNISVNKSKAKRLKPSEDVSEVICISDSSFNNSINKATPLKNNFSAKINKCTLKKSRQTKLNLKGASTKRKRSSYGEVIVVDPAEKTTRKSNNKTIHKSPITIVNKTKTCVKKSEEAKLAAEEYLPWTDKYQPTNSKDLIGNKTSINKFVKWLEDWRERIEKEKKFILKQTQKKQKAKKKCTSNDSDSDFYLSDEELFNEDNLLNKVYVIIGSSGSGKTATVHTCAKEIGFKILELNASSTRGNKQIMGELKEATQSHLVSKQQPADSSHGSTKQKANSFANYFKPKKVEEKTKVGIENLDERNSLILFDEAEAILEQDKGFWPAVQSFINISKRPIVICSTDESILNNIGANYHKLFLRSSSLKSSLVDYLDNIANKEHVQVNRSDFQNLVQSSSCDIRQCISQFQFWSEDLSQKVLTKTQKHKKQRRRSKTSKFLSPQKSVLQLNKRLSLLSARRYGIYDDILSIIKKNEEKKSSGLFDILCHLNHRDTQSVKQVERILESLNCQGDFFLKYRMELLTLPSFKKPSQSLSYSITKDELVNPSNDFNFLSGDPDFDHCDLLNLAFNRPYSNSDQLKNETQLKVDPQVKIVTPIELSCDDNSNSSCSLFVNSNFTPDKHLSKLKTDEFEILDYPKEKIREKLEDFSSYFDVISEIDYLSNSSTPNLSESESCRVLESNLDELGDENGSNHSTFFEIQSALQILTLKKAQNSLLENKVVKNHCKHFNLALDCNTQPRHYHKLFSNLKLGGNTVKNQFILDFLPSLRSICRSEDRRKNCKNSRRFLHYLDRISFFQQPMILQRLADEFEPIIKTNKSNTS